MANKAYQFPQGEPNPFADPSVTPPPEGSDNPYATGAGPAVERRAGNAYQQTLSPRGNMLMVMSLLGVIGSLLALAMSFCLVPVAIFSLLASIPAMIMARHDLQAMQHGAMERSQHGTVYFCWVTSIIATVLGAVSLAIIAVIFLLAMYGGA